ncbi:MAG: hypothetical protein CR217_17585 [Beijerinckiaceae bacterium]|nr:MAG: hypothetical protein CR217_17585 [Beijerinckiaceae bacterium]
MFIGRVEEVRFAGVFLSSTSESWQQHKTSSTSSPFMVFPGRLTRRPCAMVTSGQIPIHIEQIPRLLFQGSA